MAGTRKWTLTLDTRWLVLTPQGNSSRIERYDLCSYIGTGKIVVPVPTPMYGHPEVLGLFIHFGYSTHQELNFDLRDIANLGALGVTADAAGIDTLIGLIEAAKATNCAAGA